MDQGGDVLFAAVTRVIGIGAEDRGDDAAGLLVARLLRVAAPPGVEVHQSAGDAVACWICSRVPNEPSWWTQLAALARREPWRPCRWVLLCHRLFRAPTG